jgi:hypothetical protein
MFSQHPEIARRFAAETPKGAKLPEHVKKKHRKHKHDPEVLRRLRRRMSSHER